MTSSKLKIINDLLNELLIDFLNILIHISTPSKINVNITGISLKISRD